MRSHGCRHFSGDNHHRHTTLYGDYAVKNSKRNRLRQERAAAHTKIGRDARVSKYANKLRGGLNERAPHLVDTVYVTTPVYNAIIDYVLEDDQ